MSGIVAIVNFDGAPVDPQVLKAMAEQCAYRGPDGIRYWIRGNVGLAHLALHATPESLREVQPMLSADGTLCLTADVRVDNRPELIHLLNAKGENITNPTPPTPTCSWQPTACGARPAPHRSLGITPSPSGMKRNSDCSAPGMSMGSSRCIMPGWVPRCAWPPKLSRSSSTRPFRAVWMR